MSGTQIFFEDFENGANGNTITTGNTSFSAINGAGTATFDNTVAATGSLSGKFVGATNFANGSVTFTGSRPLVFVRFAAYVTAFPAAITYIHSVANGGTDPELRINVAGTLTIRNNAVAVATTTNTVPLNTWFLIERRIDNMAQTQDLRLYSGLSGSPLETASGLNNQGLSTGTRFGLLASTTYTIWIDAVSVAYDDWLGPLSDTPSVGWLTA